MATPDPRVAAMAKSSGRATQRAFERATQNAALCKLPIAEYLALSRTEKKRRLAKAKAGSR